jgi:hypothetical protein
MTLHMKWYGDKAQALARKGAARGLQLGAEHVLEEANRIVPIDESTLLKSGHAWPPSQVGHVGGAGLQAAVTYDTPYAVRQHEELTWRHDAGRQAKYLEQPINTEKPAVETLIAREVKRELGA